MDNLLHRNGILWGQIENEGYRIEQFLVNNVYTTQPSVYKDELEAILELYRGRKVRVAPPTAFILEGQDKVVIFDGNKRALAMLKLVQEEGYVSTDKGLYPSHEAFQMDCGIYLNHIPLAILKPHGLPGYSLHHITKTEIIER